MRILITGISGFVGGHLAERLLAEGEHAITGFSRDGEWPTNLKHLQQHIPLHTIDLLDSDAIIELLTAFQPDWIFHLAGYANTGASFREPGVCWSANLTGTRALYDAVSRAKLQPRIVFASTGLIYGDPDPGCEDLDENAPLRPASPYAASKAAADLLSYQVWRNPGLQIMRVRLFNQIGPRQAADYAIPNFARQLAAIERGQQAPVLQTGNLSAYRDLTDVRDMVNAFVLVMKYGQPGEAYNAGSGRVWQISEVLRKLVSLTRVPVEVKQDTNARGGDTQISKANIAKLQALTGWVPSYELMTTLQDVLDDWRNRSG